MDRALSLLKALGKNLKYNTTIMQYFNTIFSSLTHLECKSRCGGISGAVLFALHGSDGVGVASVQVNARDPGNGTWGGGRERSMDTPEMGQTPNEKAQRIITRFSSHGESILIRSSIQYEHALRIIQNP